MSPAPCISELRLAVCRAAGAFEPALLDRAAAMDAVSTWSAIANAAQAAAAMAAARVHECGAPAGSRDAADWVARTTGTSASKAKERIKTGKRLREQARTRKAAIAGRLSSEQSDVITDAVDADPEAEEELLDTAARKSHAELRDECAKKKAAADPDRDATERRIDAKRCLRRYTDREGAAHLHATGTKRDMAKLDAALSREADKIFNAKRVEGIREPYEAYLFDALINLADNPSDQRPKQPTTRHLGLIRVDRQALVRGHTVGDETCEIAGLGPIPVSTARDMLGESIVKLVMTKGVDVVNVVHLGRGPIVARRIALLWSQPRSTNEACGRMYHLEIDHREAWAHVHETALDNLDPLCSFDHQLKTLHGWSLVHGTGPRPFVPPQHPDHPAHKRRRE